MAEPDTDRERLRLASSLAFAFPTGWFIDFIEAKEAAYQILLRMEGTERLDPVGYHRGDPVNRFQHPLVHPCCSAEARDFLNKFGEPRPL